MTIHKHCHGKWTPLIFATYLSLLFLGFPHDALPSSLLDPLEGLSMLSCGKLELEGRSRFPALKGGKRGVIEVSGNRLGRGTIMLLHGLASKTNTSWLELILHPFGVVTSHGRPWTHLTHHGPNSGEATTFPHIVFSALLRGSHIRMALFPGTPKEESWNCPRLNSRGFRHSYLLAPTSDWSEVWTKVVALFEIFPIPYRTPSENVERGRFPTFSGWESNCQFDSRPFFCP